MIEELDLVALTCDVPKHGLVAGDLGTVVHRFPGGSVFLVEFVRNDDTTVAVEELTVQDIRPLAASELSRFRRA